MRKGLSVLLLAASAWAGADEEIARIFEDPSSIPGKLDFDAYAKILKERGHPKTRATAHDLRLQVAGYFGNWLSAPCVLRRVRVAEDGATATAVVDHGGWLMRWFLVRTKDRWWYADFEDVNSACRFTDWDHVPKWLGDALDADDEKEAVKLLASPPEGKRAATIETARLARLAYCHWILDREKEALKCCDEAAALCDAPVVELRRSYAAMTIRQYDLAVKAANAYLDAVGEDPEGCRQLGRSLSYADKKPEAAAAHLRGLKADPNSHANLLGLFGALPDDGKAAAIEYFLKLQPLAEWFNYLGRKLADDEEWASVDALIAAYRKGHEDDPAIAKYEALALAGRGRHAEAAPLFLGVVPKCGEDRAYFASMYLKSMAELKKPIEGYDQLRPEDRDGTWSYLAELCAYSKDAAALDTLLAKRRDRPDAAVAIWEIELRWLRKEYGKIDALYRDQEDKIDASEDRARWRPADRRIRSLLRTGKPADAVAPALQCGDPILLFAVYAALGRTEEAARVLESVLEEHDLADFDKDEDAGPLLRGEAFAALRQKHGKKE